MYDSYPMKKRKRNSRRLKIGRFEEKLFEKDIIDKAQKKKIGSSTSDFYM